jgi:hypothetical protein
MKSDRGLPDRRDDRLQHLRKHDHGRLFRWKLVPFNGSSEYGAWLGTEADVRVALLDVPRRLGGRYYCEAKRITCPECDTDQAPAVICAL